MRNRIVKEGFFRSYELSRLHPLARILFEGLWCLADKNGRLWDRPEQIKAEVLPYDDCNVADLLSELSGAKFILRYESSGRSCIQVINFEKHQALTSWEKASYAEVPPPKYFRSTSLGLQDENVSRARVRSDQISTDQNSKEEEEEEWHSSFSKTEWKAYVAAHPKINIPSRFLRSAATGKHDKTMKEWKEETNGLNATNRPGKNQTATERRDAEFRRKLEKVKQLQRESSGATDETVRGKSD